MKPKRHVTKWSLVLAIKVRRFDTRAEADAEGDKSVERGERGHIVPPLDAWAGRDRAPW
jgi:hypothetical protein